MIRQFVPLMLLVVLPLCAHKAPEPNPPQVQHHIILRENVTQPALLKASTANTAQSPQQTQYSHGNPTDQEQLLLEFINRARMNPPAEGDSIYNTKDPDVVNAMTYWKVDKAKVRADFKTYPKRPPLAFHPKAITAARAHSADMRDNKFQSHTGSDGSNPGQRLSRAGYSSGTWGENIFAYAHSMWEAEVAFLVDWGPGNEGLGHRHNTINFGASDPIFTEIGIGVYAGTTPVGPWVVTEDFGVGFEKYILGVVYKDKNNNKMYDAGEGISGVTITPSQGSYYAVSSASGGYAIPMGAVSGTVTVTASGAGVSEVKSVTLTGSNVKVDFGQATTPAVFLIYPEDNSGVDVDTTKLRWRKTTGADFYHVQLSRDNTFTTLLKNDSTVKGTDTSYVVKSLMYDSTYYWRVRAKSNTLGWGEFSPPFQFSVIIFPSIVQLINPPPQAKLPDKKITFSWHESKPGVTKYWFEVARDTNFLELALQDYDVVDTTWVMNDPDGEIHADTTYYWHVAAFRNSSIYSEFSPRRAFIISGAPNAVNEDQAIVVSTMAPNPVHTVLFMEFDAQSACKVSCSLYNELGEHVARVYENSVDAGRQYFSVDFGSDGLSSLPSGTYFLRLTSNSVSHSRKLILQR